MLSIVLFILFFPHWLYFKPHVIISLSVCPDREVKWTSRHQVLRSATHKLLKNSFSRRHQFSTNGEHSWLKIAELCVQASLYGFGFTFGELYEHHAVVVFAGKAWSHPISRCQGCSCRPRRPKLKMHICSLRPLGLYFRTCSPSIALLLLSSNSLLCSGAFLDQPA